MIYDFDRIYGKAKIWKKLKLVNRNLKLILTGCVLEKDKPKMGKIFDAVFEIKELDKLPPLLDCHSVLDTESIQKKGLDSRLRGNDKECASNEYLNILPKYESLFRAFVPIMTGCNNFCSYCAVPYVRGREKSRAAKEIIAEVKSLIEKGYKEITLLGQNVNSYGVRQKSKSKSQNYNSKFISLLKKIDKIVGDYRVYFYSNHPKDMSDELIKILPKLKHFPRYLHLPLQSGNNDILAKMNRYYTQKQYLDLVAKIKKTMPDVALTTDIIVGFPGETKKQFEDTKKMMEKVSYDMAFLAQYSLRPGTIAAKMVDDVPKAEKVRRGKILQQVLAGTVLKNNKKLVGKTVRVLIDEQKNGKWYGRTEGYKVVEIDTSGGRTLKKPQGPTSDLELGQFVNVKILKAESWKLIGKLV